ncbi:MAG: hypothetical protein M9962_11980 [Oligoflexia bacterium]|nr:hypothetical protein [Oligoflexia bacterium]
MLVFLLFISNFAMAGSSPLEGLSGAYVSVAIEDFQKFFPDQEQQVLNQLWSKSMGVEDDLYEAELVANLKKSGFSSSSISYKTNLGITNVEIKSGDSSEFLEVRNPFLGEFSIRQKVFFISDFQRSEDIYDAIYDVFKKSKLTNKQKNTFAAVSYILIGLIGTKLDSQKCFNDLERAIADIRSARKECVRTFADAKKGKRKPASEDYLAKTILLKGMGLDSAKDPFCMDFAMKIETREAKSYFYSKYSCVNSFRTYCRDVIELVNCQNEMNIMAKARTKGSIQSNKSSAKEITN